MKRVVLATVSAFTLAACQDAANPTAPPSAARPSASVAALGDVIPGHYLVSFRPEVTDVEGQARLLVGRHSGVLKHLYKSAIRGFAASNLSPAAAAAIAQLPFVAAVEQDQVMHAIATQANPPSWGLDRIDQRPLPLDNSYTYNVTGAGVVAYIIDTGILFGHSEFGGRAVMGVDEVTTGGTAADCNGHGTHVSGTVGGATYGVAKGVSLVAVRVLDCGGSGTTSGVAAGVDWVTADHGGARAGKAAVANMSLGGGQSPTLDQAVSNSIAAGVTYAIAAGNGNIFGFAQDACTTSPADVPTAITVSATDITDTKASWANYGTCVKIFGPGVNITSSWYTSPTATNTISGTSMATPHVTGTAALYLEANPGATPAAVLSALTSSATAGVVKSAGTGSPNKLLYSAFIGGAPPPPPGPPTARFTYSCSYLNCNFDGSTSSAQAGASYGWAFGDATSGSGVTASHAYGAANTYNVTLTVTDAGGTNATTQAVTVTAPPPGPVASFTSSCSGRTCNFDASASTGSNLTYSWNFGDGRTGSGVTTSRRYRNHGTFTVVLTVTDGAGRTSTATKTVTV
ncbi:MAG: S8 family serine peptidase [Gemmatimonadota bacterium]|nr:S8 family serine peptidase [Gemmatimonadota bacterium]